MIDFPDNRENGIGSNCNLGHAVSDSRLTGLLAIQHARSLIDLKTARRSGLISEADFDLPRSAFLHSDEDKFGS